MTRKSRDIQKGLGDLPFPSRDEMESARERIFTNLSLDDGSPIKHPLVEFIPERASSRRWVAVSAVAVVVILATFIAFSHTREVLAVVDSVDGSLYRMVSAKKEVLALGASLHAGQIVHANGESGGALRLADGSRVEMRTESELVLERVDDGVRIHLSNGSVIVTAASQPRGHLYVQTKDAIVSVTGTVFLVSAEPAGSRVAVIEGEVRVMQGVTEQKLRPGQQVRTTSLVAPLTVEEAVSWSPSAVTQLASLTQQATPAQPQPPLQPGAEEMFEAVSIRPYVSSVGGGRGGADGAFDNFNPCTTLLDPKRFRMLRAKVVALISMAYIHDSEPKMGCPDQAISGLPDWVKSEWFNVEATASDGPPLYTVGPRNVKTPTARLEGMLRQMLADRFGLVVRREPKETDIYALTIARNGSKLTPSKETDRAVRTSIYGNYPDVLIGLPKHSYAEGQLVGHISGRKVDVARLVQQLKMFVNHPIVDKTGLTGEFDYETVFAPTLSTERIEAIRNQAGREARPIMTDPILFDALERDLGLELKPSKEKVETIVIDKIHRPTEN